MKALFKRHDILVEEMLNRGYTHRSPLDHELAVGEGEQHEYVDTVEKQKHILKEKGCDCKI